MRAITDTAKTNILKEQFIPDHLFFYIVKGGIRFFDGTKSDTLKAGEYGLARKNHLAKFELLDSNEGFEPVAFCFDEPFLRDFLKKYQPKIVDYKTKDAFIKLKKIALIEGFIQSLKPYYKGFMKLDEAFEELKYEELLLILLKSQPELAGILFHFGTPEKINLEAFMNRNFQFNVSVDRFAFLTGRSLSAFKRDFKAIYNETPSRWLVKRRLEEAYFLLKKNSKPSDVYLDLGFESLSHFSVAFKKQFGLTPSELAIQKTKTRRK